MRVVPQRYIAPLSLIVRDKGAFYFNVGAIHESPAKGDHNMQIILIAAQITVLLVIGMLLWQIWHKFKSIPEDEVIGEDRTKYMTRRLTWIALCAGFVAALRITSAVLRMLEII